MGHSRRLGGALVAGLLTASGPPDVSWLVVAVVVDPVDGVLRSRSSANIFKKGFVAGAPTITDRDSAGTVPPVAVVSMVFATLDHVTPSIIFLRETEHSAFAVLQPNTLSSASTTYRMATAKLLNDYDGLRSTVALTEPSVTLAICRETADSCQAAESLAGQVEHLSFTYEFAADASTALGV